MIRALAPSDWMAFRDIRLDMLRDEPEAYAATLDDWQAKPEAMIRDWLAHIDTFGDYHGTRIVSCAAMARARAANTRHRAEVIAVYTRPEMRGQGRMRAVFEHLAGAARKAGIVQLELQVNTDNTAAIAAYERIGFAVTGRVPRAVRSADRYIDDLSMVWPLDQSG